MLAEIEDMPTSPKVVGLHPGVLAKYERQIEQLQASLAAGLDAGDRDGAEALRELIEAVVVERDPARDTGVKVIITGRLNAIPGGRRLSE